MGVTFIKKWVWVVLAFSVALNIGVIATVIAIRPPKPNMAARLPSPVFPGIQVLEQMDLSDTLKKKVADSLQNMNNRHFDFMELVMNEEEKMIDVISQPGPLDKVAFEKQKQILSRMLGQTVSDRVEHLIEIRQLIGPEKTRYFFKEIGKRFKKRMKMERSGRGVLPPPPPGMATPGMMKRPDMEKSPAD